MGESNLTIVESVIEAFTLTWDMYKDAIENIPDEHWRTGDISYLVPARLIYHVLEASDFYSGSASEGFPWGYRFKVDWESASPEQLPTKEQARAYLQEMQEKVGSWLGGMEDLELLSPETEFTWTGSTVLGRALYLLVHCRQHLGEINAELRRRGLPRIEWRTF